MEANIDEELKEYFSRSIILDSRQMEILYFIQDEFLPELTAEETLTQALIEFYSICSERGRKEIEE